MSDTIWILPRFGRPHAERAVDHLAAIVENVDQPPCTRVAAACALLDLAQGRPMRRQRAGPGGAAPPQCK